MLGYVSPPFGDEASLGSPPACAGLHTGENPGVPSTCWPVLSPPLTLRCTLPSAGLPCTRSWGCTKVQQFRPTLLTLLLDSLLVLFSVLVDVGHVLRENPRVESSLVRPWNTKPGTIDPSSRRWSAHLLEEDGESLGSRMVCKVRPATSGESFTPSGPQCPHLYNGPMKPSEDWRK